MDDLSILDKPEFARCPGCKRLMDISLRQCPHCGAFPPLDQLRISASIERETNRKKSRINDRNALIYGVVSLFGASIVTAVHFGFVHLHLWSRVRREGVTDVLGHLWAAIQNNLSTFIPLFFLLPIATVVLMRWQRRDR
jgi:hypothetical protein